MKRITLQARLVAIALLALGASTAQAQSWGRELRQDDHEIRQDRQELRSDYRELHRDRADYARARAAGDIQGMRRERMEIRQDMAEIHRDRAELRRDLRERRKDAYARHYGGGDYRRAGWNHDRHESWNGHGQEQRANFRNWREERHDHGLQPTGWHGGSPANSASPTNPGQGNNGRHLGWNLGRGNRHGS